jgi:hypothetical protein
MDLELERDLVVDSVALVQAGSLHRIRFHGTPIPNQIEMIPADEKLS